MTKILVATTNPGKIRELSEMLDLDIDWLKLSDFDNIKEVVEDGDNFTENARKKAIGYAKQTGVLTIADDSGLAVDALGGEPGVHSARYSGEKPAEKDRTLLDHSNMAKVLRQLKETPKEKRTARFVCHICLADPEKVLIETEGTVEGLIAEEEKGNNGFGYDPIFYLPEYDKTVAQLSSQEKNRISHRGNAIRKLKPLLKEFLAGREK